MYQKYVNDMKVDYSPRGSGKTIRMIQWLSEKPDRVLLTFSDVEAKRLQQEYDKEDRLGLSQRICTFSNYIERRGTAWSCGRNREVAIDNADIILQGMIRDRLSSISISSDL